MPLHAILRFLRPVLRWGVVIVCLLAMAADGASRVFPLSVARDTTFSTWDATSINGRVVFRRIEVLDYRNLSVTSTVRYARWRMRDRSALTDAWSPFRPAIYFTRTIYFGGFWYDPDTYSHQDGKTEGFLIAIPFYFLWLPTLPFATWIIAKSFRNRQRMHAKGFEPITE